MKKWLCILLALLMTLGILASCAKEKEAELPPSDEGGGTTSDAPNASAAPETIDLIVGGVAQYYVLCRSSSQYGTAAEYVLEDIRRKTGIALELATEEKKNTSLHRIVVGGDYAELFPDAEVRLSAEGYAALWQDGDIYLCGYTTDTVLKAAKKWLSSMPTKECITKDANGAVTMTFSSSLLYVFNPEYTVKDPTLVSEHIASYRIVYDEDGRYTDRVLAESLSQTIASLTGFLPAVVSDAEEPAACEILCGPTNRKQMESLGSYAYSITNENTRIYLNFGSAMAFDGILSEWKGLFGKETLTVGGSIAETCKIAKDAGDIRIMTSNVLFGNDSSAQLPWKERAALLTDLYLDFKPDFIGLQEAAGNIGTAIRDGVAAEYAMVSQSTGGHTPILYRTDTWRVARNDAGEPIQNMEMFADNFCWDYEWVMFENIADPSLKVIMMNLHFHPDMAGYREKRPADMDTFNAEVRRLEQQYPTVPMFVTGDYNTAVSHTRGDLNDGWADDIIAGTKLQSGGQLTQDSADAAKKCIDHISTNAELVDVIRHQGVSYDAMKKTSDHIPYFIDVRLKNK